MKTVLLLLALTLAGFSADTQAQNTRLILVGDSTMAPRSGYGDALCARFRPELRCVNLARGGRSSGSFRAEGLWEHVLELLRGPDGPRSYVLIQFGHNDQPGKPGRSTDLVHDFPANLARYVDEVRATGATPVLLTPLTRRSFRGPWLHDDLAPWAAATRRVAADKRAALLDLHALSRAAVQAMGEAEADTLAMAAKPVPGAPIHPATTAERAGAANPVFDRTHLGDKGARLIASIVARQLQDLTPELGAQLLP
ncbi:rhamnogalacturonan acetylesterase [Paucibacter sp. PLA-PC-4]|uniref:rhamnogalacturonan acetylesterase n=1 Tax=Paucibacter sp. PLA-PC-4 TaxID=2993655 RepID=UPI002248C7BF|nr:rhamnogalacturonan acetylesterase [Paucibacter sp. PLA-PC-4]MCX2860861.1 rhamnogalacturonan acetylesterase [Paucibacter sp. PLA-PC-4]